MKTAINKKASLVFIIVISAIILAVIATTATYAIWAKNPEAKEEIEFSSETPHPSEKYIVYHALNGADNFTTESNAVAYAVVGYTGLVHDLVIPETHNGKPVTKICTSPDGSEFNARLSGNSIVKTIVVPESVTVIAAGVCQNMGLLEKVTLVGSSQITIEDLAFANCPYLSQIDTERPINGTESSYLLGSGI